MTFEAYVKSAIGKAVVKAHKRQAARERLEQSFSTMTDADFYSISQEDKGIRQMEQAEAVGKVFRVHGIGIPIYGERLGQVLMFFSAMNREIILMYYYLKMSDPQISRISGISKSTVHRRRNETIRKLHILLEDAR